MFNKYWFVSIALGTALSASAISEYKVVNLCLKTQEGHYFQALRSFVKEKDAFYLGVDTETLQTRLLPLESVSETAVCPSQRYGLLKARALQQAKPVQNAGIVEGSGKGYALTVDMCPSSKKGYERAFYLSLIEKGKMTPVTISITGRWIEHHQEAFLELVRWSKEGSLEVTWMNHGFSHPYIKGAKTQENFINLPGVDFDAEIVDLEKLLLSYGVTPSIFYRFAGLVSTQEKIVRLVSHYGLIPIGSRAWIAKGEPIKEGSIVLVHGNKNEPKGIDLYEGDTPTENLCSINKLF